VIDEAGIFNSTQDEEIFRHFRQATTDIVIGHRHTRDALLAATRATGEDGMVGPVLLECAGGLEVQLGLFSRCFSAIFILF
jgi:hypothetical protein